MISGDDGLLRNVTREVLADLLPGLLEETLATLPSNGNGKEHQAKISTTTPTAGDAVVPQVPAPPIARVHRPSGWRAPAPSASESPAELPASAAEPAAAPDGATVEHVALRSDADLDAFVRALVRRLENPRDRMAILSGTLRFQLASVPGALGSSASAAPAIRIEKGAVTERTVREAAEAGARLVLSPRAVLTPLARDRARSLGVEIDKERPC